MKKILIVDDDKIIREQIAMTISNYDINADFLFAENASSALELASSAVPDLILMDMYMEPGPTGLDALKDIKNTEKTSKIPVIIISGHKDSALCLNEGADDWISKPLNYTEFIHRVQKFLHGDTNSLEKECFTLMPFKHAWSNRVYKHIRQVCERNSVLSVRADEMTGPDILVDIIQGIKNADMIIADMTQLNPNVMYELGFAHAIGKQTILLTQNVKELPFDLVRHRCIPYEDNTDGFQNLEKGLTKMIQSIKNLEIKLN